ncbi:MAG TPA: superoxide dismutase [Fibrobacteraceae bacterium]|nr:superoxide dismutase [Fibrobacteraceae bacterium]
MAFELPKLPYAYDALEPHYDRQTVEIHHTKHHNTYTVNFNKAVEAAGVSNRSGDWILTHLEEIPADKRTPIINAGGGWWNHNFFWESISPKGGGEAIGKLAVAIAQKWGSFAAFKEAFTAKAIGHFGSGWAWLVVNKTGELEIVDTHDQVCPISSGLKPLTVIDVWEHAYYLKYKNVRPDWVTAWWNLVDWNKAEERFNA